MCFTEGVDWCIGRYLGRLLIDKTAAMSVEIRSSIVRVSIVSRSIYRPSGVSCRSTDRPTVGRDSIGSVSAMYRWIVDRVLVRYRWCIGIEKMTQHSSSILGYEAAGQNWFILFWPLDSQSWNDSYLRLRLSFDILSSLCLVTGTYSTTSAVGSCCAVKRLWIG